MSDVRKFTINLAIGGHSAAEVLEDLRRTFGDRALSKSQVYKIVQDVRDGVDMSDHRGDRSRRTARTPEIIEAVSKYIEEDCRVSYEDIGQRFGLSPGSVNLILHEDLGLVKKLGRWVSRLLTSHQKARRLEVATEFVARADAKPGFLGSIVTIMSLFTQRFFWKCEFQEFL